MEAETIQKIEPSTHRNDLLKIIALFTMFIDHTGYLFFPGDMLWRTIGRIAFPIFAYQVAVGYQKTSDLKKYASRLLLFACISQVPYLWFNPDLRFEFYDLNIMFTLLASLGLLYAFDHWRYQWQAFVKQHQPVSLLIALGWASIFFALLLVPEYILFQTHMGLEYGIYGLLLVLLFHVFGRRLVPLIFGYLLLSMFNAYYRAAIRYFFETGRPIFECFMAYKELWQIQIVYNKSYQDLSGIFFQSRSIMAIAFIWFFNWFEKLGKINVRLNKYVGYWFYPVHISILLAIKYFMLH